MLALVDTLLEQVAQVQQRLVHGPQPAAEHLRLCLEHYVPLVQRVVAQTRQRVVEGLNVPSVEKLVSVFEPHTAIICRGKAKPHETEFGCKIWHAEVDGGLVTEYRLLRGNPSDTQQVIPSVEHHRRLFGRAPRELSGDRGTHSAENERQARALGVRRVSLPRPGHKTPRRHWQERQRWYRAAQRFRAGIEGRISQLRRARGLKRCLNHGWPGLERWVGWGVIANNIAVLVNKSIQKSKPRRSARRGRVKTAV